MVAMAVYQITSNIRTYYTLSIVEANNLAKAFRTKVELFTGPAWISEPLQVKGGNPLPTLNGLFVNKLPRPTVDRRYIQIQ